MSKIKIFRIFEKLALFTPNPPVFQLIIKIHVYSDVCLVQWVFVHRGTVARFWLPKWALHIQNVLLNTDAEKSQIYVVYAKNQKSYFAKIDFLVPNHLRYDHQVCLFSEKMDFA